MHTSTVRRTIKAPIQDVFDWLADPANYNVIPGVSGGKLSGGLSPKKREFRVGPLLIDEDVPVYQRPNRLDYQVRRGFPPLHKHGSGSMRLRETPGGTEVTWITQMTVTVPAIGDLLVRPFELGLGLGVGQLLRAADKALTRK